MERKTSLICRCRPFRGLALALFALFGGLATAAQAMLLTVDLRWDANTFSKDSETGNMVSSTYKVQEGSIIQVIGYKASDSDYDPEDPVYQGAAYQFEEYGETSGSAPAAPFHSGNEPSDPTVYLANTTYEGHTILYTGTIQEMDSSWYGLYTQFTVDSELYDTVYIRVFGATSIAEGTVTASYWGVSDVKTLHPDQYFNTDTFATNNVEAGNANYFEVIPEPATLGLLGMGAVALAAWRRRRFARPDGDGSARLED